MQVQEVLAYGVKLLKENNIEDAYLASKLFLSYIIDCRKEDLIVSYDNEIDKAKEEKFICGIEKISKGYPVQYLTNTKEFMKMDFYVDENVLIPRSDTETLVEEVILLSKKFNKKDILELCTGSGAIAISLAKYLKDVNITATDISSGAINIAKKNENKLLNKEQIKFIETDMFGHISGKFDIIVSNPPYIKTKVIEEYNLKYEPQIALDGGDDGLLFYKIIIEEGYKYLKKDGIIALEIGYDQKQDIIDIVEKSNKYKKIYSKQDLNGNDRIVVIN